MTGGGSVLIIVHDRGGHFPLWFVLEASDPMVHCLLLWARPGIQDVRDLGIVDVDVGLSHDVGI